MCCLVHPRILAKTCLFPSFLSRITSWFLFTSSCASSASTTSCSLPSLGLRASVGLSACSLKSVRISFTDVRNSALLIPVSSNNEAITALMTPVGLVGSVSSSTPVSISVPSKVNASSSALISVLISISSRRSANACGFAVLPIFPTKLEIPFTEFSPSRALAKGTAI